MSHSGTDVSGGVEHGNKWFRYRAPAYVLLLTAISIILVILGVFKQSPYPDSCSGILYEVPCRLYNIARIMVFDVNPSEEFSGNWVLSLGLLCVAVTAGFMGLTLWFRVFTKVKLSRLKDHIVVCGLETVVGRQIAINYRKNNQTVVAVGQDIYSGEKKHYIDRLRNEEVLISNL